MIRRPASITVILLFLLYSIDGGVNRFFYDVNPKKPAGYAIVWLFLTIDFQVPVVAYETCFNLHIEGGPVYDLELNSVLPDLEGFELLEKTEEIRGHTCRVWFHEEEIQGVSHKYWYYEYLLFL